MRLMSLRRCGAGAGRAGWRRGLAGWLVYLCCASAALAQAPADPLFEIMAGEFALQEGATLEAADRYAEAALRSADPEVVERATRLALMAGKSELAARGVLRWRELDPDAKGLPQIELSLALTDGDAEAAQASVRRMLKQPQGWKPVLQVLASERRSLLVRTLLNEVISSQAVLADLDALLAAGGLAARLDLAGAVERVGIEATRRHAEQPRAWLWQADAARRRNDFAVARSAVEQALALPDISDELRMAAAGLLSTLGDPAAAAAALATGNQTPATLAGRAAFLSRAEDQPGLAALYDELKQLPPPADPARTYLLGQLAELLERWDEASAWYETIPPGEQADQGRLRLAVIAEQRGDLDTALAALRQLQASDSDQGRLLIDAHLLEAELLGKHDRGDDAIDAYTRGLAVFEDDSSLLYARALMYERLDRIVEAEADLRRLLALDPDSVDAMNALGYTLADRTERFEEAHQLIREALRKQPDNPAIIDSMGWVLFRMGRAEEALPHLRRAFELQRDAEVAAHLGQALWAVGKQDEARSIWRLGAEIDPDNRAIQRVLEQHPLP